MWTVREAAEQGVAAPTITAALNSRFLSSLLDERKDAAKMFQQKECTVIQADQKPQFINDVKAALYCSKICSYTQGMNLIRKLSIEQEWNLDLGFVFLFLFCF